MSAASSACAAAPLLQARDASVAVDGVTMISKLSLSTRGDRVLLVGSSEVLLAAISGAALYTSEQPSEQAEGEGIARVVGGALAVLGKDVARGQHRTVCAVALLDPPLPPDWSVGEYLKWSARLSGATRGEAGSLAEAALERLGLGALFRQRLPRLAPLQRRGVVLASAIVSSPAALILVAPLSGAVDGAADYLLQLISTAARGRALLTTTPQLSLDSAVGQLARSATDICLMRNGHLVMQAQPTEVLAGACFYELTVRSGGMALRRLLAEEGLELRGGPLHYCISLPEQLGPNHLLKAAAVARASVVACVPLIGAR